MKEKVYLRHIFIDNLFYFPRHVPEQLLLGLSFRPYNCLSIVLERKLSETEWIRKLTSPLSGSPHVRGLPLVQNSLSGAQKLESSSDQVGILTLFDWRRDLAS